MENFWERHSFVSSVSAFLYGVLIGGLIGWGTPSRPLRGAWIETDTVMIMSPYQFQKLLNELEPDSLLELDGIIGKATLKKWDRVFCNESAERYFDDK